MNSDVAAVYVAVVGDGVDDADDVMGAGVAGLELHHELVALMGGVRAVEA
jgi:hypothetical protein